MKTELLQPARSEPLRERVGFVRSRQASIKSAANFHSPESTPSMTEMDLVIPMLPASRRTVLDLPIPAPICTSPVCLMGKCKSARANEVKPMADLSIGTGFQRVSTG
jgi:hypothetical protein